MTTSASLRRAVTAILILVATLKSRALVVNEPYLQTSLPNPILCYVGSQVTVGFSIGGGQPGPPLQTKFITLNSPLPPGFVGLPSPVGNKMTSSTPRVSGVPQRAGSYSLSIGISDGSGLTWNGTVVFNVQEPGARPAIVTQPSSQTATVGSPVSFAVVTSGSPAPSYQWFKDGSAVAGGTNAVLNFSNATPANAGSYLAVATNSVGSTTSASATLTIIPPSALSNLSVRTTMAVGQTLTVGAVVKGGPKNILLRAGGPALNQFGLQGIADPNLTLYTTGSTPIATNDDWPNSLASTVTSIGAFPYNAGSKDAALTQSLDSSFTAQTKGTGAGVVLVEIYDVTGGTATRLVNVSARNIVGTGANVLIAGFNISGTGTMRLLIRGVGPGLAQFGVAGALFDPLIQVFDSKSALLATNDSWDASLASIFGSVGAFSLPANSKDAALVLSLPVGAYSVQVSGADGGTGDGIVEVYELP